MSIFLRIANLLHRSRIDRDIDAELQAHIALRTEDNLAAGIAPEEARRDATNAGRVSVIAEQLVAGSPPRTYEERVSRLEAVSPAQIQALAHRLFAGKHLGVVTMY